jgi:protein ImuA
MLQTRHAPAPDALLLAPGIALARTRAHEATGPARAFFALLAGGAAQGPILWLQPGWFPEKLNGDGVLACLDPGRLIFGTARTDPELLAAVEEALRSGLVPLVVVSLAAPPGLTAVRRLHLAAEAGAERGTAPLALLLTPDPGGAAGVETRWHITPSPGWTKSGHAHWTLTRARARMAPQASWRMTIEAGEVRLTAVPAPEAIAR